MARGTVRVRTTAGAVAVVRLALVLGAVLLVLMVRATLIGNVRAAAELRAGEIAATLGSGPPSLAVSAPDEQLIQILDRSGRVVAASANVTGRPALVRLAPGATATVRTPVDEDEFLAVAARAADGRTVIVARALADAQESTQVLLGLLALGIPLLLVVVGVTTWQVVGRALAPVAAIGREVEAISAVELHRRVPEPEARDEIGQLARTMNRMLGRLESARATQQRFVSDASHELRTPTASVRQHAEVALAHPARVTVEGLAESVHAEALRLQRLIDDLLLLARADEAGLALRRVPVDVDDLAFAEAARLRPVIRVDTSRVSAGQVAGDPSGLRSVIRNLADNAARHASAEVAFAVAEQDGTVTLTVDDDGPGIPETDRTRVLRRFVRLADARARDEGGSGLGLAIVSELVAAHGGTVVITSAPLGGARVVVTLPAFSTGSASDEQSPPHTT